MLVQCLKDAVLHLATASQSTTQEVGGERGAAPEAVAIFNDKVTEFDKCLKQMAGHMGMLVLKQKKAHLVSVDMYIHSHINNSLGPKIILRFRALSSAWSIWLSG